MSLAKPMYLMAGGRPRDTSSMVRCLQRAFSECDNPKPSVAYIGTASADNLAFFTALKMLILQAGAGEVTMARLARPKADTALAKRILQSADVVFVSGGEVADGMKWLIRHEMSDFLHELYKLGKLFVGVSAGSIMLGSHWVRWEDENDDNTASLFDCLGLVPKIFDTHAEDEDWKELKTALRLMGPGSTGYGIVREGMIRADHLGNLIELEKKLLLFANDNGTIRAS